MSQPKQEVVKPLYDMETYKGLVGSIVMEPSVITEVSSIIDPLDFTDPHYSAAYRAALELHSSNKDIDLITLAGQCRKYKGVNEPDEGWNEFLFQALHNLDRNEGYADHAKHYAQIIKDYSALRKLAELADYISGKLRQPERDAKTLLGAVTEKAQELSGWYVKSLEQSHFMAREELADIAEEVISQASEEFKNDGKIMPRYGFDQLDGNVETYTPPRVFLLRSTLTAFIADTGVGKTSLLDQIAEVNEKAGLNFLYLHNEVRNQDMAKRKLARLSGISFGHQLSGNLREDEKAEIRKAVQTVVTRPGRVDYIHCPGWDVNRIAAEVKLRNRLLQLRYGVSYDGWIFDYIQKTPPVRHMLDKPYSDQLKYTVENLADLANEMNMAGIIVSQPKRNGGSEDEFIKPTLHDGLGTSAIEQRCNQIFGLWRDKKSKEYACPAELVCLKNTFGESDWTANLFFYKSRFEFAE